MRSLLDMLLATEMVTWWTGARGLNWRLCSIFFSTFPSTLFSFLSLFYLSGREYFTLLDKDRIVFL